MSLWRVRITMPADPASQEWLAAALAGQRVLALRLPCGDTDATGEVIIDLPCDDSLGALLSDLHMISPQVFISSAGEQAGDEGAREPVLIAAGRPVARGNQVPV